MSVKNTRYVVLLILALTIGTPASALAQTAVSRTVTTVTAGEVAGELAKQVKGVELGSAGATVTLDVNGKASPVTVSFAGMLKGVESGKDNGWLALAAIPAVGGALVKLLNILAKLGH